MHARTTKSLESSTSSPKTLEKQGHSGWFKVSVLAAASALVGGVAAAWFYRKTLHTLREAESEGANPEFRMPESDEPEDA